jgi:hypothetical protein
MVNLGVMAVTSIVREQLWYFEQILNKATVCLCKTDNERFARIYRVLILPSLNDTLRLMPSQRSGVHKKPDQPPYQAFSAKSYTEILNRTGAFKTQQSIELAIDVAPKPYRH